MSSPYPGTSDGEKALSLRQHCERILKELESLHARCPSPSLERSIQDARALLTRVSKDETPRP